jgi:hypothetical protein
MNYDEARQRQSDGRWDWTTMNDGAIRRKGRCRDHEDGHATRLEAVECYWDYCFDRLREVSIIDTQRRCAAEGCREWTSRGVEAPGLGSLIPMTLLCEAHRAAETLRSVLLGIHPPSEHAQVIHS